MNGIFVLSGGINVARNKPADGSHIGKTREKTPTPGHKGQSTKQQAHSAKQPPMGKQASGKQGSISISKGSLQKSASSIDDGRDYYPPAPKPGQRNKKNKKKTYELYVKIDIVSKYNQ
ncbi:unnamed protein product [Chironomus riparius]|uniref:Uncharacterized protein n=1 Tax=Chironomus riparius TaxID=315576 RepID=A0A9N9WQA5_9DIPT|nr:unnamed protein product [Chironomus riparius]